MMDEKNLELDATTIGRGEKAADVVRIAVATACAFTRDGGAPTISVDCRSYVSLEQEVERLREELDAVLAEAREHFGIEGEGPERPAEPTPEVAQEAAHLDTELCVSDVMTRDPRTLGPNDPVSLVDELMKAGRFRHVVVVEDDAVVGVVSQRDIFYGAIAWTLGQGRAAHEKATHTTSVKQVMKSDPIVTEPGVPLVEAARILAEHKIGCLPVVEGERVVGILTEGDFLSLISR